VTIESREIMRGLGAAPGRVIGPCHVVRGPTDATDVPAGAILVIRVVNPYLAPLFFRLAGVVVEEGGLLQHATILAREFGLPAVVGIAGATESFVSGEMVEIRGDTGEVIRGTTATN
jgi:phosphohistidine swiveling domain-containing protein